MKHSEGYKKMMEAVHEGDLKAAGQIAEKLVQDQAPNAEPVVVTPAVIRSADLAQLRERRRAGSEAVD